MDPTADAAGSQQEESYYQTKSLTNSRRDGSEPVEDITTDTADTANVSSNIKHRDSTWLELEVCREFSRGNCSRSAEECRYAHPIGSVVVKEGKVTCCFDYLKDRCSRDTCKYLHPPSIIKDSLIMAGKQYGQTMSVTSKTVPPPPLSPTLQTPLGGAYPIFIETSSAGSGQIPYTTAVDASIFPFPSQQFSPYRIQVCENFDNNITCPLGSSCFYAHPESYVRRDSNNSVSCCWNYLRGYCRHSLCWFYHPPPHIMYTVLHGGMTPPQLFEPFMMGAYYANDKSPYSSPTGSLGQYSYSFPHIMSQYSPPAMSPTTMPSPVTNISTLPQAIVQ